jgi:hypothetical protein
MKAAEAIWERIMKRPGECLCSITRHKPIVSTNTALIRLTRKKSLDMARYCKDWQSRSDNPDELALVVRCCEWTAYECLMRLRELEIL